MRGEAFNFSRLGTFLERADDTARILDVKYHILLPRVEDVGGALDYYQWAALLRSVSSFETYRTLYRDQIFPINVARAPDPRAAHAALARRLPRPDREALALARPERPVRPSACRRAAGAPVHGDIEEIFQRRAARVSHRFLEDISELGSRIQRAYLGAYEVLRMRFSITHQFNYAYDSPVRLLDAVPAPHAARHHAPEGARRGRSARPGRRCARTTATATCCTC